jgi:hypothetical protein
MSFAFGGPDWPIRGIDLSAGPINGGQCLGVIFDLSGFLPAAGTPNWIIGDAFLVRFFTSLVPNTGLA